MSSSNSVIPASGASSTAPTVAQIAIPELRSGTWTRLGGGTILGDPVTEGLLDELAEQTREVARAQGYSIGWAEGRREAAAEAQVAEAEARAREAAAEAARAEEHRASIAALRDAATHLHESVAATCDSVERRATQLAWAIVEELVRRELTSTSGPDLVRRALSLLPQETFTHLRLHPAEIPDDEALLAELTQHGVTLVPDASVLRGDALCESADHVIDLRISTALNRVREALK